MLSIGKLSAGAEDYYLRTVADGVEEYYVGSGEAPGYWIGSACGELGLAGEVGSDDLRSVLAARSPATGESLGMRESPSGRVAGFDLTFSAPKSVSLLWGLGLGEIPEAVRAAHDRAVAEGLGYIEAHGTFTRRGSGGVERIGTSGLIGAAFRHRTSRTGDPQLHTHVLVANAVHGADGRWSTLDARVTYYHARTAGFVYEAVLRTELASRLGLSFGPVVNGIAEIDGMERGMLRAFSTRRVAIRQRLAEWGTDSARAAQFATLETRPAKPTGDRALLGASGSLAEKWRERAGELGFDPARLDRLAGPPRYLYLDGGLVDDVADHLLSPAGLTAHAAAFERRDVVREVAASCPDGANRYVIEHIADQLMSSPEVVALGRTGPGGEERYTTRELLAIESDLKASALGVTSAFRAVVDEETVEAVIASRPTLSAEQADMVRRTTTSGDGVEIVIGVAGAGKTYALDAAREAWNSQGHRVFGAALSARAAGELADGANIDATTIAYFEHSLTSGSLRLGRGDVVIVDEAGMVGTRQLASIVDRVTSIGGKVLLVGDDRQLPEIDAGGSFSALAHCLGATRLTDNRRQVEVWERHALAELRHGNVPEAVQAFELAGRIHESGNAMRTKELLVESWCDAYTEGHDARMYAARIPDVDELNGLARAELRRRGFLGEDVSFIGASVGVARGEEVMCLRNDRQIDVVNGTRGTVLDAHDGHLVIATDKGIRTIPPDYLDAGHLTYGYASTIHKAQGATVDRAFVYGTASLFRESGYVAMSRARERTDLFVVTGALETGAYEAGAAVPHGRSGPAPQLAEVLSISRAKSTAESEIRGALVAPHREVGRPPSVEPVSLSPQSAYDRCREATEDFGEKIARSRERDRSRSHGLGR